MIFHKKTPDPPGQAGFRRYIDKHSTSIRSPATAGEEKVSKMNDFFKAVKVSEHDYWVGAVDWNVRKFHG